jgi:Flp pilus assembly protein TadD
MRRTKPILALAMFAAPLAVFLAAAAPAARAGESAAVAMQQALAEYRLGHWPQAAAAAAALAGRPDAPDPRAWIVAGAALERLGQNAAAAQAYTAYLTVCPDAG